MSTADLEALQLEACLQQIQTASPETVRSLKIKEGHALTSVEKISIYLTIAIDTTLAAWYHSRKCTLEVLPREIRQRIFLYTLPDGTLTERTDQKKLENVLEVLEVIASLSPTLAGDVPYLVDRIMAVVSSQVEAELAAIKAIVTGKDAQNMPVLDTFGWFERYRRTSDLQVMVSPLQAAIVRYRRGL